MTTGAPYKQAGAAYSEAMQYLASPPKGIMLPWWPRFSNYCNGLRPNEVTLFCAPTGAGKSAFLASASAQLLEMGIPQFCAPVETGGTDHMVRVISALERKDMTDGSPQDIDLLRRIDTKYAALMKAAPMYISKHEDRVPIEEMVATLGYMHDVYGVKVALLDNLNFFMKVESAKDQVVAMDHAIHSFVVAVKELPIHVILVVHPRKTDKGRVESEFDIKGSSTAVQECANCILMNRPGEKDLAPNGQYILTDRELVFRKLRKRGAFVGRPIWFKFANGRYDEIAPIQPAGGSNLQKLRTGARKVLPILPD